MKKAEEKARAQAIETARDVPERSTYLMSSTTFQFDRPATLQRITTGQGETRKEKKGVTQRKIAPVARN